MKILALVPARRGSQRVPGKNLRVLGGKPLINWTIEIAKKIPEICDVLVSTDDSEIALVAAEAKALVPWLRPETLATDTASSVDVALHALNWYESKRTSVDGILLLQPTSPFRSVATIKQGIKLFVDNEFESIVSVSPSTYKPDWFYTLNKGNLSSLSKVKTDFNIRTSQFYVLNGNFYLTTPIKLRKGRNFIGPSTIPLIIEQSRESLDIDTEWDFRLAEILINS